MTVENVTHKYYLLQHTSPDPASPYHIWVWVSIQTDTDQYSLKDFSSHRMMSSTRASPPYPPSTEDQPMIGQDSSTWANEDRDIQQSTPPLHNMEECSNEPQPMREKQGGEGEWENSRPTPMVSGSLTRPHLTWSYRRTCSRGQGPGASARTEGDMRTHT